ncbi:MAG: DUF1273 family protein [Clostridia bacterium]|nr:DUF1273 domain-containing protein [Oscillospiraceae bacterium]MBQ7959890.1 DUF1273 family protein [Clostridia bacterium]
MSEVISSCCFSGHRELPEAKLGYICGMLEACIDKLAEEGCEEFVSGGALGFDLLAAEAVLKKKKAYPKIRLVMALPCRNQHEKWSAFQKTRYERILEQADEIVYLCESYVTGCMQLRNKYMVDRCDFCVAFLSHGGGTQHTVNYATEKGKRVVNLAQKL